MKKILTSLLMFAALATQAQIIGTNITVTVTPDHKDWMYKTGEQITFTVNVLKSGTLLDDANISYEMGPEMYPEVKKDMTLKDGSAVIKGKMSKPGFYKLKVTAHVSGKNYEGWCSVAVSPELITPTTLCPKDFDEFWAKAIEEARWTALEPHIEYLPERSTADVNTYHVSFQNDRWGRRVYAILNVPTKPGKYPALLRVPGAGVRPYTGDEWFCKQGAIVLEIGIHGIPVIKEQAYYDQLFTAALADYWHHGVNDRDRNYYKHVVTGCIRAIDLIESLGNQPTIKEVAWDGKNLAVTGSSQGGFLTLATTALDKRVSCYGAVHAALCDHEASLKKVACGWPHYFYDEGKGQPKEKVDMTVVEQTRYYDGVNFARRITVPGYFSFGFNDNVVPPTTAYGTFNVAGGEKTLSPYQKTAHFWYQEQWDEWNAFLLSHLGIKQ
ncbi:MAG: acetylxylan esterase [Bacteroidaceae bacterium]|nr:acetylxylan esterase [Bacteroidaceae bacterium]